MTERVTFPQTGDKNDAEYFGALAGQDNLSNFVETGMGFTVDYTVPEVTIADGKAYVQVDTDTASTSGGTVLGVNRIVQVPQTTISLTDNDVNHIYVEARASNDDSGRYDSYTNTSNAPSDSVKIGEVDTSNDTKTEINRLPDIEVDSIDSRELLLEDGSASDPTLAFDADTDTGIFRNTTDEISIATGGTEAVRVVANQDTSFRGNALTEIGGLTDAGSGAVRLANNEQIKARNSGDSGDLTLIASNGSDDVFVNHSRNFRVQRNGTEVFTVVGTSGANFRGGDLFQVGGTTAAQTGAIRLANNQEIAWRNSGDTGDNSLQSNSNDNFVFQDSGGRVATLGVGAFTLEGQNINQVGGTTDASVGAIRLGSGTQSVYARDATSSADYGLDFNENSGSPNIALVSTDLDLGTNTVTEGVSNTGTISESSSPTGFTFSANADRDLIETIDVTVTNNSGSDVSDINTQVDVYDGSDSTGILVEAPSANNSSLTNGSTKTVTFQMDGAALDGGTYYVEVSSAVTVDQTDVNVSGSTFTIEQSAYGDLEFLDQNNKQRLHVSSEGGFRSGPRSALVNRLDAIREGGFTVNTDGQSVPAFASHGNHTTMFAARANGSVGSESNVSVGDNIFRLSAAAYDDQRGPNVVGDSVFTFEVRDFTAGSTFNTELRFHSHLHLEEPIVSDVKLSSGELKFLDRSGDGTGWNFRPNGTSGFSIDYGQVDVLFFNSNDNAVDLPNGPLRVSGGDIEAGIFDDGAIEVDEVADSLSDTSTTQLSRDAEPVGYGMIQDTSNGETALIRVDGTSGNTTIVDQAGSHFSTTQGNAGTVNVFHDGSSYQVENQTGNSITISAEILKS